MVNIIKEYLNIEEFGEVYSLDSAFKEKKVEIETILCLIWITILK